MKKILKLLSLCAVFAAAASLFTSCQQSSGDSAPSVPDAPAWIVANADASSAMSIHLRWAPVSGATDYAVTVDYYNAALESDTNVTKPHCTDTEYDLADPDVKITTAVSFTVTAANDAGSGAAAKTSVRFIPSASGKTSSKWLVLLYGDADCNGMNPLWYAEQNFCTGLKYVTDTYGAATADQIKVVTLWDGSAKASDVNIPVSSTDTEGPSASYLYELKAGSPVAGTNDLVYTDYSSTASWITDANGNREVDMSDYKTLTNFLLWAQGRYSADHTVVMFLDHGAGACASPVSRAVCQDNTSTAKYSIIWSDQLRTAFTDAGYGTNDKKVDMIYMDVCLEGNFEEAYEFKDVAKYYLASENSEAMLVSQYSTLNLVKNIGANISKTDDDAVKAVAKAQVKAVSDGELANELKPGSGKDDFWPGISTMWKTAGQSTVTGMTTVGCTIDGTDYKDELFSSGGTINAANAKYMAAEGVQTLSCVDLSEMDELAAALDGLAGAVSAGTDAQRREIACRYFKSDAQLTKALVYGGTGFYLIDIGKFAYEMQQWDTTHGTTASTWSTALKEKAKAVTDVLENTIIAAWSDCYRESGTNGLYFHGSDTSADNYGENEFANNWFGLTVAAGNHDFNWFYGYLAKSGVTTNYSDLPGLTYYSNLDFVKDHPIWAAMRTEILGLK